MDKVKYSGGKKKKLANLIGNGGYGKIKYDLTLKMKRKLSQVLRTNEIQTATTTSQQATTYTWSF